MLLFNIIFIAFFATYSSYQILKPTQSTIRCSHTQLRMSKYIPPEMDPEYRKINPAQRSRKTSSITTKEGEQDNSDAFSAYPVPKEGDIVQFPGKWGDKQLGRIRFLRYIDLYESYYADIIPLVEGKSENVFVVDRGAQSEYMDVKELAPVSAYFVRSENGFKVYYKKDKPDEISLKAPRYRNVDKNFTPTLKKAVDFAKLDNDFLDYEEIKTRITFSAIQIGTVFAIGAYFLFGLDSALTYEFGVLGGCAYFFLLGKKVDTIGASYSAQKMRPLNGTIASPGNSSVESENTIDQYKSVITEVASNKFDEALGSSRLIVPLFILMILAAKGYLLEGTIPRLFKVVPKNEFIAAMSGFLTLRLSIFLNEVTKEFRGEDLIGLVPGSVAISLRAILLNQKENETQGKEVVVSQKVLFVSGPAAAGRNDLYKKCLSIDGINTNNQFQICKLLTTNSNYKGKDSIWYDYMTPEDVEKGIIDGDIVFEGKERDDAGRMIKVYLSFQRLTESAANSKGASPFAALIGPPDLLDILYKLKGIKMTSVWVSLKTKQQFMNQAALMLQKQAKEKGENLDISKITKQNEEKVTEIVNEAAGDINYYMQKVPLIDYTILNSDDSSSTEELKQLLINLKD